MLAAKGIASPTEIAERIAITDSASPGQGARMVAKAWTDPDYRARMLEDGSKAAEELGIPMRGMPPLGVLENSADVHNLVVCTLCSCYPRAVLGYPPLWYKSAGYRARAVRDPRGLLADEWGTTLPGPRQAARGRFDRGLSLDGAAAAPGRDRGLGRTTPRVDRARGRHDRGNHPARVAITAPFPPYCSQPDRADAVDRDTSGSRCGRRIRVPHGRT